MLVSIFCVYKQKHNPRSKGYVFHYLSLISSYQRQEGACSVSSFGASSLEESLCPEHDPPIQAIRDIVLLISWIDLNPKLWVY